MTCTVTDVSNGEPTLAEAYKELAKGEQAASVLEANLDSLEARIDALLSSVEQTTDTDLSSSASQHATKVQAKPTNGGP
ncbi:hypothetical protein CDD82_3548 [Ophiocordyceps australis]|uniref:Uncharacterized protein n=1 Tax=Ophiocordyceps australis TaxID=1399860 RepID=A0A2C5ZBI7_9HYPO|nr:hypothetical protein CDD82_3548 [Ophiocordyceps australis]